MLFRSVVKKEEVVVKKEEIKVVPLVAIPTEVPKADEKPAIAGVPTRPEIKAGRVTFRKNKKTKTFAPESEIKDLKTYLKPTKGPVVQVIVAWKERILTTYHYRGTKPVRVNSGDRQLALPDGLAPKGFPLIDLSTGLRVNATNDMAVEMISSAGIQPVDDLFRTGKAQKGGTGYSVRVEQSEMICMTMPGGNLHVYIRFVPSAPVVPMAPSMLTGSEMTGVIMSIIIVGLLALYISATTPKDWQENKQEDLQRIAQVVFDNMPKPTPTPTPTETPSPSETASSSPSAS